MKRFNGWEPVTVYEYDDAGRLMGSRPEPEWDDTERAWMLALEEYRTGVLCPCGCGFPKEISQAPQTEFAVSVPPPTRCHIRTALAEAQKGSDDRPTPEALLWGVEFNPEAFAG